MPRLIDEEELIEVAHRARLDSRERIEEMIESAPTIDAVPVVRCKDCKWGTPHPEGDEYTKCFKLCTTFFSGHYCAWGEKRR